MSLSLGEKLKIRAMVYVAGEPIPFFWPMRAFIHHNPLHGLEQLPFEEAVQTGTRLFHGRGYLPRQMYQRYLAQGKVDARELAAGVNAFIARRETPPGVDLPHWLNSLMSKCERPVAQMSSLCSATGVHAALHGSELPMDMADPVAHVTQDLRARLLGDCPVYEAIDALYGEDIGAELDELVIKSCLDFFDEGQSVFSMPLRKRGFFAAWREVARRNIKLYVRGLHIRTILAADDSPEGVIAHVMRTLQVPEDVWASYFTRELARLHGWSGFVRWRASVKHYYWDEKYPADLVDLIAVRLTLALALLSDRGRRRFEYTADSVAQSIAQRPMEMYLRHELYTGRVLPAMAHTVDCVLARGRQVRIARVFDEYVRRKCSHEAAGQAKRLHALARLAGATDALLQLDAGQLRSLLDSLREFERHEGIIWLRAMEAHAMTKLIQGVNLVPANARDKRPFVQALFCIDTRSERIRRHLESMGDYQTFGIAGFFGVPVSFMELGKGSETHLCPVLLTPKNLVLEMTVSHDDDMAAVTALGKALHELKESVFSPYVTVEAIGLLFGMDMLGKTLMPQRYARWRKRLHQRKPSTHLLLDKLSREQADSIVRAVQRAVIVKAVEQDLEIEAERITDDMVRELREAALGAQQGSPELARLLKLDETQEQAFIQRLREVYRIDPAFARLQMERLARIGFSLDEQVGFVTQALFAIGLTSNFSRFVLLVGHGSTSDNNPYESALDCGACGGNHGLVSARVLAQMANKPDVRRRLRSKGIDIADDAWFVPALHDTTTDNLQLFDLDRMPSTHVIYLDRLRNGLLAASRLCAQERLPSLQISPTQYEPATALRKVQRNAVDWSQVRPEWGLARNAYFIIGQRALTRELSLEGRAFLHSYDYRIDPRRRLLENILSGPLVVGQWINMEHYFSTVDNERYGSGSKVYHNVAGRFGVMTGNLSDLRTGLPSQTVLDKGVPYHEPLRLITVIEAPIEHAQRAVEEVVAVRNLVRNGWIRLLVIDPEQDNVCIYEGGEWQRIRRADIAKHDSVEETSTV